MSSKYWNKFFAFIRMAYNLDGGMIRLCYDRLQFTNKEYTVLMEYLYDTPIANSIYSFTQENECVAISNFKGTYGIEYHYDNKIEIDTEIGEPVIIDATTKDILKLNYTRKMILTDKIEYKFSVSQMNSLGLICNSILDAEYVTLDTDKQSFNCSNAFFTVDSKNIYNFEKVGSSTTPIISHYNPEYFYKYTTNENYKAKLTTKGALILTTSRTHDIVRVFITPMLL